MISVKARWRGRRCVPAANHRTVPGGKVGVRETGRPLRIVVVVPYGDGLFWSEGSIYSYYEFDRPLSTELDDAKWKELIASPLSLQAEAPKMMDLGLGLRRETLSREALSRWLESQSRTFSPSSFGL